MRQKSHCTGKIVNATLELLYGDTGLGHRELQDSAARYSETQAEWLRRARPESLARDLAKAHTYGEITVDGLLDLLRSAACLVSPWRCEDVSAVFREHDLYDLGSGQNKVPVDSFSSRLHLSCAAWCQRSG